jgi:hypothetical protein
MKDEISRTELVACLRELATPINFDELVAQGLLKRKSLQWYEVPNPKALPSHVSRQAREIKIDRHGKAVFRFPTSWKQAQSMYKKMTGESAVS